MEKKNGKQRIRRAVRCGGNNHNRKDVTDWKNWYLRKLEALNPEEKEAIELYRWVILSTADRISEQNGLTELETLEDTLESFSYEIAGGRLGYSLDNRPAEAQVAKMAKKVTWVRIWTWFNALMKQRDAFRVHLQGFIVERDDEGEISDVGIVLTEWSLPDPEPNPYLLGPEACLLKKEEFARVKELANQVGRCPTKKASLFEEMVKIQFSGEEVGCFHKDILGVKTDGQLRESKSQAFGWAQKVFAKTFPDLVEKQKIFKSQKGKKWKVTRLTERERRELFRTPKSDEMKPSPVRILDVSEYLNSTGQKALI